MALKAFYIRKQIELLNTKFDGLKADEEKLNERSKELESCISEITEETEQEVRDTVTKSVDEFEAEKEELEKQKDELEREIEELEKQLNEEEKEKEEIETEETEERADEMKGNYNAEEQQARSEFVEAVRNMATGKEVRTEAPLTQGNNGVIVPASIASEIITRVKEISPILEKAHKYNVVGDVEIPYYPADAESTISAVYKDEMDELVSASGDFGTIKLQGFLAGALAKISKKLLNNTTVDVLPFIIDQMVEAFKAFYDKELIVGTANKVDGLVNGITQKVTAAKKSAITADELIDIQLKVPTALQAEACWIMTPSTFKTIRKLKDGQGNYLIMNDFVNGGGYVLLGKPVYLSDFAPELGTADNMAVIYGDLSGLAVKFAEELEVEVLRERFATQHAVGILGWAEVDGKVENAQKLAGIVCGKAD